MTNMKARIRSFSLGAAWILIVLSLMVHDVDLLKAKERVLIYDATPQINSVSIEIGKEVGVLEKGAATPIGGRALRDDRFYFFLPTKNGVIGEIPFDREKVAELFVPVGELLLFGAAALAVIIIGLNVSRPFAGVVVLLVAGLLNNSVRQTLSAQRVNQPARIISPTYLFAHPGHIQPLRLLSKDQLLTWRTRDFRSDAEYSRVDLSDGSRGYVDSNVISPKIDNVNTRR